MRSRDIIKAGEEFDIKTTFDKIQEFWLSGGNVDLTPKQNEINKRWKFAFMMMENEGYLDRDIANAMVKEFDISKAHAYRDIKSAKALFGDVVNIDIKLERYFALQSAKQLLRVAKAKNDLKAWGTALSRIIEIAGINSDNVDADFYKKLEQHNVFINISDHDQKLLEFINQSGSFDFSKLANEAEEIPWEKVEQQQD